MDNKIDFSDRLKNKYRLIVLNDDTLDEIKSYRLKLWHFLGLIVLFLIICILLMLGLVAFTPLGKYVSEMVGIESNAVFIDLNKRILDLEKEMASQEVYKIGIENMLNGVSVPDSSRSGSSNTSHQSNLNSVSSDIKLEDILMVAPLNGLISADYDASTQHYGIDITAPKDSPVKSILPGSIIQANWNPETGHTICVQHAYGLVSIYKHNSSLLKEKGEIVQKGESIAIIGNSGELTTGPHLHFELWHKGMPQDPKLYFNFN